MGPATIYDRTTRAITNGYDSADDGSVSGIGFFVAFIVVPVVVVLFICCFMACRLICTSASCYSCDCSCSCCCCCCKRNRRQRRATTYNNVRRTATTTTTTTNTSGVAVNGARRPATDNGRAATNTSSVFTISWNRSRDHPPNGLQTAGFYNDVCFPPSYDDVVTSTTSEDYLPPYESVVINWDQHEHPPPKDDTESTSTSW